MKHPLRIAVADDERDMREYFHDILPRLGHEVVCAACSGEELISECRRLHPDLVITDIKMPDMDGLDAVTEIYASELIPVIVVSGYHHPELVHRAGARNILAYLVKPIKQADLEAAIAIAVWRFEEFQTLRRESLNLRQALEDRKIIERAKGILMKRARLDEPEAFRRMQQLASNKNQKLVEIAHSILTAAEILE